MEEAGEQAAGTQRVLLIGGAMRNGTTVIHRALCTARNSNPYVSESWLRDLMAMYSFRLARFEIMGADQFRSRADYVGLVADDVERYLSLVSARHSDPEVLILKHPELIRSFVELAGLSPRMSTPAEITEIEDRLAFIGTRFGYWG